MHLIPWKHRVNARPAHVPANFAGDPFSSDFDRLIERVFSEPLGLALERAAPSAWSTPVDVTESPEAYVVRVELPGVDPKDVEVTLEEGLLTVQGEKKAAEVGEGETRHVDERRYGSFRRSFVLPSAVDESKVSAVHEHGVLRVELAKLAPTKPRRIEIKAS